MNTLNHAVKCNPATTAAGFALYVIGGIHLMHVHQLDTMLMGLFAMGTGLIAAKDGTPSGASGCEKCDTPKPPTAS